MIKTTHFITAFSVQTMPVYMFCCRKCITWYRVHS